MDAQLRRLERTARALPGDPARPLAHARELIRAGRPSEARDVVRGRLRQGRVDGAGLTLLCELARQAGALGPGRTISARPQVGRVLGPGAGRGELTPVVAFVGPLRADASAQLCELIRALGPEPSACRRRSSYVAYGEHVLDVDVRLPEPWQIASEFEARSLRLLSLPGDPVSGKFRRQLLREVSALVVLVPAGTDPTELDLLVRALDSDQRRASAIGLDELPVLLHYEDPACARSHPLRVGALGLSEASWAVGRGEHTTALAWLLSEVARAVHGLVRPRTR